jgi:protein SCO1/2
MKNKSYIGISFIILVFGIYAIPKIIDGFKNNTIVKEDRMSRVQQSLSEGEKADLVQFGKVPAFQFINQDSIAVGNDFFKGKGYVLHLGLL